MKRLVPTIAMTLSLIANITSVAYAITTPAKIDALGPGTRIHGMDISYYQHPGNASINFKKMYAAGIRFVIIKGGDSVDANDAQAVKYMIPDRKAAQAALMYTSFYYYATLPNVNDKATIIKDAKAQAQKVIWRIASLGGYNKRDLPVALDMENNCVVVKSGACTKYTSDASVTLWAQTWLDTVAAATGKKPFIYSYPQFLETAMNRSTALREYPLWLAHYSIDPAVTTNQPNAKSVGCYADSWTNQDCTTQWQIWQYTSCGIPGKYGVPGTRVDLNVFNGNSSQFLKLVRGQWQPDLSQMLPINEPTTMTISTQSAGTTKDPVLFSVNVARPDGSPVVTGTVNFVSASTLMSNGKQVATRNTSGSWLLSITNLSAGNYVGTINFIDQSGTEAPAQLPVVFTVAPAPSPSPSPSSTTTPKPKPTPNPKPTPVDSCPGQIRN